MLLYFLYQFSFGLHEILHSKNSMTLLDRLLAHGGEMDGEASAPAQTPAKTSTTEESMEESQQSDNVPAVNASGSVDNAEAKSLKCDE